MMFLQMSWLQLWEGEERVGNREEGKGKMEGREDGGKDVVKIEGRMKGRWRGKFEEISSPYQGQNPLLGTPSQSKALFPDR